MNPAPDGATTDGTTLGVFGSQPGASSLRLLRLLGSSGAPRQGAAWWAVGALHDAAGVPTAGAGARARGQLSCARCTRSARNVPQRTSSHSCPSMQAARGRTGAHRAPACAPRRPARPPAAALLPAAAPAAGYRHPCLAQHIALPVCGATRPHPPPPCPRRTRCPLPRPCGPSRTARPCSSGASPRGPSHMRRCLRSCGRWGPARMARVRASAQLAVEPPGCPSSYCNRTARICCMHMAVPHHTHSTAPARHSQACMATAHPPRTGHHAAEVRAPRQPQAPPLPPRGR